MTKYSLYQFGAEWCNPCNLQRSQMENNPLVGVDYKFVDCDESENDELVNKYGIVDLPTLVLFKDDEVINTWKGFTPRDTIQEYIDTLPDK